MSMSVLICDKYCLFLYSTTHNQCYKVGAMTKTALLKGGPIQFGNKEDKGNHKRMKYKENT